MLDFVFYLNSNSSLYKNYAIIMIFKPKVFPKLTYFFEIQPKFIIFHCFYSKLVLKVIILKVFIFKLYFIISFTNLKLFLRLLEHSLLQNFILFVFIIIYLIILLLILPILNKVTNIDLMLFDIIIVIQVKTKLLIQ